MLATSKTDLLKELKRRVEDKILEPTNYELLKKLIEKADTLDEAIMITVSIPALVEPPVRSLRATIPAA